MDKLLPVVRRDFPTYEATHLFQAGIPVYFAQLAVEVLEPQTLGSFETYFLHAVSLQVNTLKAIATFLGVEERDLTTAGANLLSWGVISQDVFTPEGERLLTLTNEGHEVLKTHRVPPVPVRATAQVHLNAMTWKPLPIEDTWAVERMDREGLSVLPAQRYERPTLGDFLLKEVTQALRHVPFFQERRLITLLGLEKITPEYLAPITVVALREQETQRQRLVIYQDERILSGESAVLQRHFETGQFSLPDDAILLTGGQLTLPASLPGTVRELAAALTEKDTAMKQLRHALDTSQSQQSGTADQRERKALQAQIEALETQLHQTQRESEQLKARLQQNQCTFLRTEEHRRLLERVFKEAREEIILVSPWMNRRTCDDALCALIASAIKRSVKIRIGYGITERPGDPDVVRNRANAQRVIAAIEAAVKREAKAEQASLLTIERVNPTHEKILICDRIFGVVGGFNWLSYRGALDPEYRRETSVILREPGAVEELAQIALQAWPTPLK